MPTPPPLLVETKGLLHQVKKASTLQVHLAQGGGLGRALARNRGGGGRIGFDTTFLCGFSFGGCGLDLEFPLQVRQM